MSKQQDTEDAKEKLMYVFSQHRLVQRGKTVSPDDMEVFMPIINQQKAEAVRQYAERLKEKSILIDNGIFSLKPGKGILVDDIDQTLKEFLSDEHTN